MVTAAAKSLQLYPTLCDPTDVNPPGSPIPGILQARILEWVAISFSNAGKWKSESEVTQLCPTHSDPMDRSLPGSSVYGIFQARVLEWGVIAFSIMVTNTTQIWISHTTFVYVFIWPASTSIPRSMNLLYSTTKLNPYTYCQQAMDNI